MNSRRTITVLSATFALVFALPLLGTTNNESNAAQEVPVIVNFGDPVVLAGAANQVVVPDDATVLKGGTVTFVVNGPGHGIAIYPVAKKTTREDITEQLCDHDPVTHACIDPAFANADHTIRDGKDNVIIVSGENPPVQRIDDPTERLFATSTQIGGVGSQFLVGTTATAAGTYLQFRFTKAGRYLVVCMNRNHYLANWMFGFVNVVE